MKRPFQHIRPFGPFIELDKSRSNNVKEAPTRKELNNRDLSEYTDFDPDDLSSECLPYANIELGAEFISPFSETTPVSSIYYPVDYQQIYNEVERVSREYPNMYIGIHETGEDNAEDIISNGFSKDKLGESTVSTDKLTNIREEVIFSWHNIWDISQHKGDAGVVVVAPRESVIVSQMDASVTQPPDVYRKEYTMSYPEYISCLKKLGPNSITTYQKDIIQDISDYQ